MDSQYALIFFGALALNLIAVDVVAAESDSDMLEALRLAEVRVDRLETDISNNAENLERVRKRLGKKGKKLTVARRARERVTREVRMMFASFSRARNRLEDTTPVPVPQNQHNRETLKYLSRQLLEQKRDEIEFVSETASLESEVDRIRIERLRTYVIRALLTAEKEALYAGKKQIINSIKDYEQDIDRQLKLAREALNQTVKQIIERDEPTPVAVSDGEAADDFHRLKGTLTQPISKDPTIGYGRRKQDDSYTFLRHTGLTWEVDTGTEIEAVGPGRVVEINHMEGYGKVLILAHGEDYHSIYTHLDSVEVSEGRQVEQGNVIAKSGKTGSFTGPKLYFELRRNGQAVNPEKWFIRQE
jgi:septal ring factor EnvC (AmiA/AmiB activator)